VLVDHRGPDLPDCAGLDGQFVQDLPDRAGDLRWPDARLRGGGPAGSASAWRTMRRCTWRRPAICRMDMPWAASSRMMRNGRVLRAAWDSPGGGGRCTLGDGCPVRARASAVRLLPLTAASRRMPVVRSWRTLGIIF
jgi:hypothetical protein